jgi:hypothetical protein
VYGAGDVLEFAARSGEFILLLHRAPLAHRVDVVDPARHPRAVVRSLVDSTAAGLGVGRAAAAVTVMA